MAHGHTQLRLPARGAERPATATQQSQHGTCGALAHHGAGPTGRARHGAAALRTPDVEASPRGPGWVRFAPAEVDGFARDRALAWLGSAIRFAGEGGRPN